MGKSVMSKFLLSIFFFLFLNLSYGEDVICAKKTKKIVTVNPGDSFTFRTQSSRFYRPNTKCIVKYKKGEFCQELKLTCSKFVIHNKSPTCTRGDKLVVVKKGIKPERYCKANPPNLSTTSNFKLAFISNKAKQAEGAECTIECSGSETTGPSAFPPPCSQGRCIPPPEYLCPEERPDLGPGVIFHQQPATMVTRRAVEKHLQS